MKERYHGVLTSKAQAEYWIQKLRKNGSEKALGAASMLARNWRAVAARPSIQPEIIAMVNSDRLSRKGGIMDTILNSGIMEVNTED